jgi:hypothetical protein
MHQIKNSVKKMIFYTSQDKVRRQLLTFYTSQDKVN